jgi:hypothetical protein
VADETTDLAARALDAPDRDALLAAAIRPSARRRAHRCARAEHHPVRRTKGTASSTKIVQTAAQELGDLAARGGQSRGPLEASPSGRVRRRAAAREFAALVFARNPDHERDSGR